MPDNPTIRDIMQSLQRRGFLPETILFDPAAIQTQTNAVLEELGEVARIQRRAAQNCAWPDAGQLTDEAVDVVIAAVCLLATVAGHHAPAHLAAKLSADDKRGWLHSNKTRDEYEKRMTQDPTTNQKGPTNR